MEGAGRCARARVCAPVCVWKHEVDGEQGGAPKVPEHAFGSGPPAAGPEHLPYDSPRAGTRGCCCTAQRLLASLDPTDTFIESAMTAGPGWASEERSLVVVGVGVGVGVVVAVVVVVAACVCVRPSGRKGRERMGNAEGGP